MKPHITSSGINRADINQSTLLIDIATRDVVRLAPADSVGEAAQLMSGKRISSIVVTDAEGHPVGIVTERNMLQAMQSGCLPETALREIMSSPVITMPESITCLDAYQVCLRDGIRHLVIVDDERRLLGVVSETDFRLHINLATLAGHRQIASVMSRSVFSLPPEASLQEALNLMHLHRDTCVVVADDQGPLGIVTERDIVRLYSGNLDRTGIPLKDVMTSPVLTIPLDHAINEAAGLMLKSGVRHLVVVDHAGRVAGLVSEHGLTQAMTIGLIDSKLNAEGAFLHTLVRTIPDMIWLKDVNGVYMACNPRFEQFFGALEKDIVGKTDYDFVGKELADFFREHDRAAMDKDSPSVNEEWVTFADDGHRELLETIKTPMHDGTGRLIGVLGIARDITGRKCMEQQLAEREKLFRAVFEQASNAVELIDVDTLSFVEANPAACSMLGYTREEYLRLRLADTQADLDEAALVASIRKLEASDGATFENRHRCKNGDILDVEVSARMLDLPGSRMLIGVWRDITEKNRAEKTLRENEAKYRQLFEVAGDGIFIQDANGFIDCNEKGASLYGLTRAEVIIRHPSELAPERQPDGRLSADFAGEQIAAALEGKSRQFEWQALRADGTTLDVEITLGRIELNGSACLQAVVRDISVRKQAEDMLRKQKQFSDDVINSLPGIFYMLNLQGNFVRVNPRFLEVSGCSQDEITGMHALDFFGGADRNVVAKRIREAFEAGESWAEAEFITKSGQNIPYYFSGRRTEIDGEPYLVGLGTDITERKRAENALRESEEKLRNLYELSPLGIALTDMNGQYVEFNESFRRICGYSNEELKALDYWTLTPKKYEADEARQLEFLSTTGHYGPYEKEYLRKDGSLVPLSLNGVLVTGRDGQPLIWSIVEDITESKRAEENLHITASVFDNSQEAIVITDANNIITEVNKAFTNITGYSREEALGCNPSLLSSGRQSKAFYAEMWQSLNQKNSWRGEIWNRRKSGDIYAELLSISVIRGDDGSVQRYVGIFSDISYLKEHEAELSRVAHYDALTGIPNRVLLADRMRQAIAQTSRERNMMAVCYLDLDSFKPINDTLGHDAGDLVLVEISRRIGKTIRGGDTVARLGGDEFVVLLLGLERGEECVVTLERLLAAIAQPITIKDKSQTLGASIGVSIYPLDDEDPDTLLRHADQAMYVAKQSGKNRFYIYDPTLDQRARSHREFLDSIGQALENNQFELYYQPKINLRTRQMVGVEALIRWHHPKRGLLSPAEFLRPIEKTELDIETGDWVIATALAQIDRWRQTGLDIEVSINISAHHLESPRFAEKLRQHLARYPGMPPDRLQIEVLETAALNDIVIVREVIESCRKFGVGFALDDFGTGYSSLSYLSSLPVDVLKIDQSFVRDMLGDKGDMAIVQGIIALARAFELQTVAEGIETVESYRALLDMGCEVGQGYHIAYPMTADELTNWHPG
ncbi:MAG: PAS domain S-box protein [Gallionella sp.]|nr:PAS domain S-box protein [Gallionella sp.]